MEYQVSKTWDGATVLEVLRHELKLSRGHLKHLKFMENGIVVNGKPVTVRYILREGDRLVVATEDTQPQERLLPVDLPLAVAYEDEDTVVPDKPADMPTHPSHNHHDDTVANALAFRYGRLGIPFVFRPVNRLDRNTSGLLLVARNRVAASALFHAMQKGEIRKRYLAILCGIPKETEGLVDTYMRRTAQSIIVRENCPKGEGGDRALTRYRVLCQKNGHALALAEPLTGRTHQLRVHFAGLGCPILGDDLYGSPSDLIGRHALHSCALSFPSPSDGNRIEIYSPLPKDMDGVARQLFGEALPSPQALLDLLKGNP